MEEDPMKTGKKFLALLLCLMMVVSLMSGAFVVGAEGSAESTTFNKAASLDAGKYYVVVTEAGGKYYALTYTGEHGTIGATEVTVSGDTLTTSNAAIVWKPDGSDHLENSEGGEFVFAGSHGFQTYDSSMLRTFVYDASTQTVALHSGAYVLSFASGTFTNGSEACIVELFSADSFVLPEEPEPELEAVTYKAATALEAGMNYVIVTESAGKYYALAAGSSPKAVEVTVSGDSVTTDDLSLVWTPDEDDTILNVGNGKYIYAGSGGFMVYSSGRAFIYDAASETVALHTKYVMTFDGTNFGQSDDLTAGCKVMLFAAKQPLEEMTFSKTTAIEDNMYYLLTVEDGGKYVALATDGSTFSAKEVGTAGDAYITSKDAEAIWLTDSEGEKYFENAGAEQFLYPSSSKGLLLYSSGRAFSYDASTGALTTTTSAGEFAITYAGGTFGFAAKGSGADGKFVLFSAEAPVVEPEDPNNWEGKVDPATVPETNNVESQVRTAKKNANGDIVLAFTSDVHYDGTHNNLAKWLPIAEEKYGFIDAMGFCGDMGSAYISGETYWTTIADIFDYMDGEIAAGNIGAATYTYGNHEWFVGAGGEYMVNYEQPTAQRLLRVGEAIKTDDYIIYDFGASPDAGFDWNTYGYDTKHMYTVWEEDLNTMDTYLASAPTDIPIFILMHYPIHIWGDRQIALGQKLVDTLNKYPNVVVLWGHNHSDKDVNYFDIRHAGDTIEIVPKGTIATINFDYMAAGTTADAEYTGPEAGSAWTLNKGLIVTIKADGSLQYDYITIDGSIIEEDGDTVVSFRSNVGDWDVFASEYVAIGGTVTPPDPIEIDGYKFVEWDTDFTQPITQPTLVTAKYEMDTAESGEVDTNYVYITIEQNCTYVTGASGTPIALYPVPYEEGMTVGDAITKVHELEYADGANGIEVTDSTYGFYNLTKVWGVVPENGILAYDGSNYVDAAAAAIGGECYYVPVYASMSDFFTPGYMTPDFATAGVGVEANLFAQYYAFDSSTYGYTATGLDGEIFVGASLDALEDTGVAAVKGAVPVTFDAEGTYYVVVKATTASAGDAVGIVTVTEEAPEEPVVVSSDFDTAAYAVAASSADNGTVKLSDTRATVGDTVIITVTPDEGYEVTGVTVVKTATGKEVPVTDLGDGTYSFVMPGTKVTVNATFAPAEDAGETSDEDTTGESAVSAAEKFSDVKEGDWFEGPIEFCLNKGLMIGISENEFGVNETTNRAMIATVLYRIAKAEGLGFDGDWMFLMPYGDIAAIPDYAYEPIAWMTMKGVMSGYDSGDFGPADAITREQLAVVMYRFATMLGLDVTAGEDTNILSFGDAASVSDWAVSAIQWAVGEGIIIGDGANLNPGATATRAEVATMLQRFCGVIEK